MARNTERMNLIDSQQEDYYKELGIAPGIPTMKGSYGDPENTGVGYNTIIKELADHTPAVRKNVYFCPWLCLFMFGDCKDNQKG